MDLLANDLSIHEQFHDIAAFRDALVRLVSMRDAARRSGREVYCHHALLTASPIPGVQMQKAVGCLADRNERQAAMVWLTHTSRLWEDLRQHGADDYIECQGEIVTESAVAEAAYRTLHAVECGLVSVTPSDWDFSPIDVTWRREVEGLNDRSTALQNWWSVPALEDGLRGKAPPIQSWDALREASERRFKNLTFTRGCFEPLAGIPFAASAAERFLVLLGILDRFVRAFDATGSRTTEGQRIYQDYFTGKNALFSDSSDSEKRGFREELTFPHPNEPGSSLFCTWHGKVRHMTLRMHYWWSRKAGDPIFVVYAGPKITKQ